MKKITLLLGALFSFGLAHSQIYTSFYNFEHVNQNLMVNPSNPHPYRFVIGLPGLSSLSVHYTNTLFKAGDYFNDNNLDQNVQHIVDNMDEKAHANVYQSTDIIFAGFGVKKGYVSFGVQQESTLNMVVPGELFRFLYYGNASQDQLTFTTDNFNIEAAIQVNYHVGYQHYLLDSSLVVGGRFKYISGAGHAHFSKFNAELDADIFEWSINTDIRLESSGSQYLEEAGNLNPIEFITGGNSGYGVDLGATYLLPKMKMSATVLNMGSITWKKDVKVYESNGSFVYNGIEIDDENQDGDFQAILDSLEAALGFKEVSATSYRSKLPMQILASYEYQLHPKHAFALTYQGSVWNSAVYSNIGLNYIGRYAKRFNLLLGYSRLSGGLNNIAFGLSAALGPLQIYAMSDNVWGYYKITELSATNLRFGINLVFFDKQDKPKTEEKI